MKKYYGFLLFVIWIFTISFPVKATTFTEEQEEVFLNVEFGIYNMAKPGRYLPLYITVEKNGTFTEGFLRVIVPSYNMKQNIYEYPIDLKNKRQRKLTVYAPVCENMEKIYLELYDQEKNLIISKSHNVPVEKNYGEVFVGILDRLENSESRLNNLILDSYYEVNIKEFHISIDEFPKNVLDLNMIDLLIVNPSAKEILIESKKKVLQKWIEGGGICIYNDCGEARKTALGSGVIFYNETDLFTLDEEALKDFLMEILGQDYINRIGSNQIIEKYWKINDLVNTQGSKGIPSLYLYVALLVLYMVTICPIVYIILKKKRRSIYYGYLVIFSSGLFSLVIFALSSKTRVYQPMVQYCKIMEIKQDTIYENNYVSIKSPDNKENKLRLDPSYTMLIVEDGYNDNYPKELKDTYLKNYEFKLKAGEDYNTLKIRNKKAFESSLFEVNRVTDNVQGLGIKAELKLFNNQLAGQVTNLSGKDMEDVLIVGYCQYYYLGRLKNGEIAKIEGQSMSHYSSEYPKTVSSHCQDANEKAVSFFISESFEELSNQFYVLGFAQGGDEFLSGSECELNGQTVFCQECEMNFTEGMKVHYPVIPKPPEVISGTYRYKSAMMESQSCVITYDLLGLGVDRETLEISFHKNDCAAVENVSSYRKPFSGRCYFMNFFTGEYEEIEDFGEHYTTSDLTPYLNDEMQLQIEFVDDSFGDGIYSIGIPFISVTGRSAYVGN